MSGITLKEVAPAVIPTPDSGKDTLFIDSSNANAPSYKDSAGVVHSLAGATGSTGPTGPVGPPGFGDPGEDGEYVPGVPGPQGNAGATGATGAQGPTGLPIVMIDDHNYEDSNNPMVAAGAGGLSYTPSLALAQAAPPGSLNVSTEGTIDWFSINGTLSTPRLLTAGSLHGKGAGGYIFTNWDWIVNGGSIFSQTFTMTVTSTAGDDCATSILSAANAGSGVSNATGGAVNFGWRFNVPASWKRLNTINIYCSTFSAVVTVTAALPNEGLSTSLTFDSGAAAGLDRKITVTFLGEGPLIITALVTTNRASTPNLKFQCATWF